MENCIICARSYQNSFEIRHYKKGFNINGWENSFENLTASCTHCADQINVLSKPNLLYCNSEKVRNLGF